MFQRFTVGALVIASLLSCGGSQTMTLYALVDREPPTVVGTPLLLHGDVVGEVTKLELAPANKHLLELRLPKDKAALVPAGSRVRLARKALIVGDVYLDILPGEGIAIAEGDTLQGEVSWLDRQRSRLSDAVTGLTDSDLREELDAFRRELEDAARDGQKSWEELQPELEKQLDAILETAREKMPQIAEDIEEHLERLLQELERGLEQGPSSPRDPDRGRT